MLALWGARAWPGPREERPRRLAAAAGRALAACAIAWVVMLSFWPWAQLSPLVRPLEAMLAVSHFAWNDTMLFDGRVIASDAVPWTYLPTWFAVTLPEVYLVALAAGGLIAIRAAVRRGVDRGTAVDAAFLGAVVLVPIVGAIVLHAVLYDAQRHFLFVPSADRAD